MASYHMETLQSVLEAMRLSLIANTALVAFGFVVTTLMLYRQSAALRDVSHMLRDVSKQVSDSAVLLRDTHALTAQAAGALENVTRTLENVTRLVVHPGGRP